VWFSSQDAPVGRALSGNVGEGISGRGKGTKGREKGRVETRKEGTGRRETKRKDET